MTRRGALWTLFVAGLLLGGWLLAIDGRLWDEGGPGIVGFELAGDSEGAERILAEWGADGRDAARLSLWLDFAYLAGYAVFWALAVRAARDVAGERGWLTLASAHRLWLAAPLAAAFDVLENVCLLVVLGGAEGSAWPVLATVFAGLKFLGLAVAIGYVAIVVIRRFPRATAALAVVGVVAVALNTWLVTRATAPADADVGRILKLPGGDIQVAESGPRDGKPVVLIHGYATSVRWWEPVLPLLPRDLRVIRVDLLGFGGSEKPRDGYSMENQADIVDQAMEALGVDHAPIVGHSMGGIVATALVQRHPDRVERLMMIGTAPDREEENIGPEAYLAFLPVFGQATDTLITEPIVRWTIETGFNPEFDPPRHLIRDIFERTTYSSFRKSAAELQEFWDERPLNERLLDRGIPVTVILGEEERHTNRSVGIYNAMGARTVVMEGLDHTPQVESPARTAPLIGAFAEGR